MYRLVKEFEKIYSTILEEEFDAQILSSERQIYRQIFLYSSLYTLESCALWWSKWMIIMEKIEYVADQ